MKKSELKQLISEVVREEMGISDLKAILRNPEIDAIRRKIFDAIVSGKGADEDDINSLATTAYRIGKTGR